MEVKNIINLKKKASKMFKLRVFCWKEDKLEHVRNLFFPTKLCDKEWVYTVLHLRLSSGLLRNVRGDLSFEKPPKA